MGLNAVQTPNATTIVFHLATPFADFNYVVAIPQTAPVPPDKDTGANYQLHPISTGPYKFQSYQLNKQLTLVPNTYWNPATDPNAKQLASKIVVNHEHERRTTSTTGCWPATWTWTRPGTGVQAAARAKILSTPTLKAYVRRPDQRIPWFAYINTKVAPLNNVHCREAIEYAANKTNLQTAYGGPVAGGAIATTVAPPNVVGQKSFDLYDAPSKPNGDDAAAKQQLQLCGQPNGFSTGITYRSDRPKEVAAAQALQASLATVGIKTTLHGYPPAPTTPTSRACPSTWPSTTSASPSTAGRADWPDGYGLLRLDLGRRARSARPATPTSRSSTTRWSTALLAKMAPTNADARGTPTPPRSTCRS